MQLKEKHYCTWGFMRRNVMNMTISKNVFYNISWKPSILLPNKTEKQYASKENSSSKIKVLLCCHYESIYVPSLQPTTV